ncbi:hypothetical protein C1I95_32970 [Micromonospora craterilacus]|uniref:DUF7694 domain-containing protein n=1 Tax=Micromonospora craterilacus TaxID=1655439 RepID=A0A2W2CZH7_9ACTN|nr:hypothetical protein C1I95_32970 [Micromonospora craterilacus]
MTVPDWPQSLNALAIRRILGRANWSTPFRFGPDGWRFDHLDGTARILISVDQLDDVEWVHASISRTTEMPSYADLKLLHTAVFGDRWAYQVLAPPADHVNIHDRALHLFGRLDGHPSLPDFTRGTGSI